MEASLTLALPELQPVALGSSVVGLARLVPRSAYLAPTATSSQTDHQIPHQITEMDRGSSNSSSKNNSTEFSQHAGGAGATATATTSTATATLWGNNKESPNNEEDSNEDDGDNATPAKVTDPLAPRLANNEVSLKTFLISVLQHRPLCPPRSRAADDTLPLSYIILSSLPAARFGRFRDRASSGDLGPEG